MASLSICHQKPIVRSGRGKMVCSACGMYSAPVKPKKQEEVVEVFKDIGFPLDSKDMKKPKEPDTRDFIRHLTSPVKYSACGIRGFRTTDKKRVNCKVCMRTEMYQKLYHGPGLIGN